MGASGRIENDMRTIIVSLLVWFDRPFDKAQDVLTTSGEKGKIQRLER